MELDDYLQRHSPVVDEVMYLQHYFPTDGVWKPQVLESNCTDSSPSGVFVVCLCVCVLIRCALALVCADVPAHMFVPCARNDANLRPALTVFLSRV